MFSSDYYHFIELLTPEEQAVRKRVREFMEKEVAPIMTEFCLSLCLFKAEFPFHIIPKLGALGVVGGSIKICFFFYLVGLLRVMAVLASPSQPMPLQQQRYLELMQAVGLLIWCMPLLWNSLALETLLELKLLMGGACPIETTNGWCLPPWILFLHMFIVP
ncbi:unnamed protein product [Brassica oleracea var. botrytis]